MKTTILITGATGTTGKYTIKNLLAKGVNVRAMVRVIDNRSKQLEAMGVEIIPSDFLNLNSLRTALKGIKRTYFCHPFKDYLPKAAGYFAKAAQENGVELTVVMSQMNVHEGSSSPATQNHLIAEDIFDWAGIGAVHIRPGLFASNYMNMAGPTVKTESNFYFPNPRAKYTIIHPRDIGNVITEILLSKQPEKHIGNKYILTGSSIYSGDDVADEISRVLNKKVAYVPIPVDYWIEAMKNDPYINDFLAKHLQEFSKDIADGKFNYTTDAVKNITGNEPLTFAQFLLENIDNFKS